ncbi:hypothetical protein D6774_03265, partial [Candidatus Woesearchaeota archaeon]
MDHSKKLSTFLASTALASTQSALAQDQECEQLLNKYGIGEIQTIKLPAIPGQRAINLFRIPDNPIFPETDAGYCDLQFTGIANCYRSMSDAKNNAPLTQLNLSDKLPGSRNTLGTLVQCADERPTRQRIEHQKNQKGNQEAEKPTLIEDDPSLLPEPKNYSQHTTQSAAPLTITSIEQRLAALGISAPTQTSAPTPLTDAIIASYAKNTTQENAVTAQTQQAPQPVTLPGFIQAYEGQLNAEEDDITIGIYLSAAVLNELQQRNAEPNTASTELTTLADAVSTVTQPNVITSPTMLTDATQADALTRTTSEITSPENTSPLLQDELLNWDSPRHIPAPLGTPQDPAIAEGKDPLHWNAVTGATTAITGSSTYVPVTDSAQASTRPEDAYTQEERQQLEKQLEPVSAISTDHKSYFARGLKKFLNLFRRNGKDEPLRPTHLEARLSEVTGTVTDVTLNAAQYISIYNDGSMARGPQVSLDSDLLAVIPIEG